MDVDTVALLFVRGYKRKISRSAKLYGLIFLFVFIGISYAHAATLNSIAVVDLEMPEYLKTQQISLSDRLRSELGNTGQFIVVERNKMKQILDEQVLSASGLVDSSSAVRLGKLLGVNQVVAGSVAKVGNVFSVSVRLIDVETGEIAVTANMDCECPIEDVLVIVLKNVARKLARLPVDEDGYNRVQKKLPEVFNLKEISRYPLPFNPKSYADMAWGGSRLYVGTYDGNIYRINTELGIKVEEVYPVKPSQIAALGWDGENIWAARMGDGNIIKYKIDRSLSIDFIFRINGADTYPYAMAINGKNIFTGGYSEKLVHYKILSPTEIKKIEEVDIGTVIDALTIVDDRFFAVAGGKFIEIVGEKVQPISGEYYPAIGIAYDGRYFWMLTKNSLIKYQVVSEEKIKTQATRLSYVNIVEEYDYSPKRPVGIAWDGKTLWTMSSYGENTGIYNHRADPSLTITNKSSKNAGVIKNKLVNVEYGYGSFTWDGESFLTAGYSFNKDGNKTTYIIRLKPVSLEELNPGAKGLQVVEAEEVPFDNINAIVWGDGYLWVATGQQTMESGEGSFIHKMHRAKEGVWEIVKTFKYPGYRCQGLAWDERNLWSYDVFTKRFYRHKIDENLSVIREYRGAGNTDLEYFSGLTWDGKYFWTANYKNDKIYKIVFK